MRGSENSGRGDSDNTACSSLVTPSPAYMPREGLLYTLHGYVALQVQERLVRLERDRPVDQQFDAQCLL